MATYRVRVTGSNGNNGLSAGAAFADPDYAQSVMTAGDECRIDAGNYRVKMTINASNLTFSWK